ncbi:MAG TPA: hypothetical protein VF135_09350 [Terriglobales bacterium]
MVTVVVAGKRRSRGMPHRLEVDRDHQITRMAYYGEVSEDEIRSTGSLAPTLIERFPHFSTIIDFSEVTGYNVRSKFLTEFAKRPGQLPENVPTVLIVPDMLGYGLARMFQIVADRSNLFVVKSMPEALERLGVGEVSFVPVDI